MKHELLMVESQKEESESDAAAWPSMVILPRPGLLSNSVGFRDDDWLTSTPIEIFKGDSFVVRGTEEGIGAVAFESLILQIRYMGERQRQGCASLGMKGSSFEKRLSFIPVKLVGNKLAARAEGALLEFPCLDWMNG
ncbi:unnamed protein product [Cochlearia groenlandica]